MSLLLSSELSFNPFSFYYFNLSLLHPGSHLIGALVITTPQEVALQDIRKQINFCKKVKIPVLGVIENMSHFTCPKCHKDSMIFKAETGGADKLCKDLELSMLGKIPLDPRIGMCCDNGLDFLEEFPDSPAAKVYQQIVSELQSVLNQ